MRLISCNPNESITVYEWRIQTLRITRTLKGKSLSSGDAFYFQKKNSPWFIPWFVQNKFCIIKSIVELQISTFFRFFLLAFRDVTVIVRTWFLIHQISNDHCSGIFMSVIKMKHRKQPYRMETNTVLRSCQHNCD